MTQRAIKALGLLTGLLFLLSPVGTAQTEVSTWIDPDLRGQPATGRMFLLVSESERPEPRQMMSYTYAYYMDIPALPYPHVFAADVSDLAPGEKVTLDAESIGYPTRSLRDLPAGEYSVQVLLHLYTRFDRADGHSVWLPMDRGEGQQFHRAPGNLFSDGKRIRLDPAEGFSLELPLVAAIPPIPEREDTEFVRRLRIKSELLSEFWGRDMHVGATVLLPKGYEEHPEVRYPVLYWHGHSFEEVPLNFSEQGAVRDAWLSEDLPRMIVVTFQHATPFYDDSYFVNSANSGPYGDVLVQELLPSLEQEYRIIRKPYARVLAGGSTGGWVSAMLQIEYPEFYGGTWSYFPDPLDFRELLNVDIYRDANAFVDAQGNERIATRDRNGRSKLSVRDMSQLSLALGSRGRSAEVLDLWNSLFSPVDEDGYPRPLWDHETGELDREVAEHWREQGFDLRHHVESRWPEIGPDLRGKLHFLSGDMDDFFLNLGVARMQEFLESTTSPPYDGSVRWGRGVGHSLFGFDSWPTDFLLEIAEHMARNAPEGEDPSSWRYR